MIHRDQVQDRMTKIVLCEEKCQMLHESGREKSKLRSEWWKLIYLIKEINLVGSREPEPYLKIHFKGISW